MSHSEPPATRPDPRHAEDLRGQLRLAREELRRLHERALQRDAELAQVRGDLRSVLDNGEVDCAVIDSQLRIRHISRRPDGLLAVPLVAVPTIETLAHDLGCIRLPELLARVLETGEACEDELTLPDGNRHVALRLWPCRDASDAVESVLLSARETTGAWQAELTRRRMAAIVASSDDAIVSKDLNGIINTWNRGARELFGYTAEEVIGKPVTILIPDDQPDEEPSILARIRRGERIDHYETIRRRKDGTLIEISLSVSPIFDREGRIVGASKIARDNTRYKRAERQRDLLLDELNHRVKNTLATVQSMASQSLHHAESAEAFVEVFESRLRALSKTHDLLTRGHWEQAALRDVILNELEPFDGGEAGFELDGPNVRLHPRMVLALGMVFHELTTNAAKYGALSRRGGRVKVSWSVAEAAGEGARLRLLWHETGGPPVRAPKRRGLGSRLLLDAVIAGFDGEASMDFHADGLRYSLDVPLDKLDRLR
ncbi:MAG TPA: PAS domain S-box protein [Rhodanobacteraceae bacterium]|nr:PAS domain S-box protein [Rhodanobacteraceae bacterium]